MKNPKVGKGTTGRAESRARWLIIPLRNGKVAWLDTAGKPVVAGDGEVYDFDKNDRAAIDAALIAEDSDNPIANAMLRRMEDFYHSLGYYADWNEKFTGELRLVKPDNAFDEITIIVAAQILSENGCYMKIRWVAAN